MTDQVPAPKRTGLLAPLDRYFKVSERGSNFAREIRGGLATFFAMAYIVVLNPLIIGTAPDINGDTLGIPQVAAVTALVAAVSSMLMGVISRYPFAIASGMGLNAILAYVLAPMMTWSDVMGLVVIEGVIMLVLVLTGFRNAVGGGAAAQPAAATATSTTAVEAPVEAPAEESPKPTKKTRSKQSFAADTEPEKTAKPGKKAKASEEQASEGKAEGKAEGKVKGGKKTKAKDGAEKPKAKRGKK